eukprot:Skav214902  [mRNA]  locus=scaffold1561:148899:149998:- [translate_table: standard]
MKVLASRRHGSVHGLINKTSLALMKKDAVAFATGAPLKGVVRNATSDVPMLHWT